MGVDKPTLKINGEMLVERHMRQLRMVGVSDVIAVCNAVNQSEIPGRTVLQRGASMSGAVLTGMEEAKAEAVALVCVNDVVEDADYRRIFATKNVENGIFIPTFRLDRTFFGGCLELDPESRAVRRINEKPEGGCRPGAAANVMIHRIRGRDVLERLQALLRNGIEYEAAVNELIEDGVPATAIAIDSWVAIKTPEDFERLNRSRGAARGSAP